VYERQRARPAWLLPLLGLLLAAGAGGGIAGALLAGENGKHTVQTVTAKGTATSVTHATTSATQTAPSTSPAELNNQAWSLMQQQNFQAALPLLQQAVQELQGATDLTTAYANYNLGVTLIALGRCSEAAPYLEVARQIEPDRHEVHDALKAAQHCSGGNGNGNNGD
jgi:tetratricopeptide (TPR) repeat protein